jgi:hypothetical protein
MAGGNWFWLGNLFLCARELPIRAPYLLTSLRKRRDHVRIGLFRVRHGIHWRTLSAQRLPGRAAIWQSNTILIKTLGPNDGSRRDNYKGRFKRIGLEAGPLSQ